MLRLAIAGLPPRAAVFTDEREYSPSTPALLLEPSDAVRNERAIALALGYRDGLPPVECLDQVAQAASSGGTVPSDDFLVEALVHFIKHDAFLFPAR